MLGDVFHLQPTNVACLQLFGFIMTVLSFDFFVGISFHLHDLAASVADLKVPLEAGLGDAGQDVLALGAVIPAFRAEASLARRSKMAQLF